MATFLDNKTGGRRGDYCIVPDAVQGWSVCTLQRTSDGALLTLNGETVTSALIGMRRMACGDVPLPEGATFAVVTAAKPAKTKVAANGGEG